jgi:hypothetical protein
MFPGVRELARLTGPVGLIREGGQGFKRGNGDTLILIGSRHPVDYLKLLRGRVDT